MTPPESKLKCFKVELKNGNAILVGDFAIHIFIMCYNAAKFYFKLATDVDSDS